MGKVLLNPGGLILNRVGTYLEGGLDCDAERLT